MKNIETKTIAQCFVKEHVSRFGVPTDITTDQGGQFESTLFRELCNLLGTIRIRTTAYHPQANGMVERLHRTLKTAFKCSDNSINWTEELPLILLGLRTTYKKEIHGTPAEMLYGENIRVPGAIFTSTHNNTDLDPLNFIHKIREHFVNIRSEERSSLGITSYIPKDLNTCSHVFIRIDRTKKGLEAPYDGPFPVIRRFRKSFIICKNNKNESISIDRLKPSYTFSEKTKKSVHFNV